MVESDPAPTVGKYCISIDILSDAYLSYPSQKGFSLVKKSIFKENDNMRK